MSVRPGPPTGKPLDPTTRSESTEVRPPAGVSVPGYPLRARDRVKLRADFQKVQASGRRHSTPDFLILVRASPTHQTRVGVTVTRKVGPAVLRNRIKRLVREVFRLHRDRFPVGFDIVWIAKQGRCQRLDLAAVVAQLPARWSLR